MVRVGGENEISSVLAPMIGDYKDDADGDGPDKFGVRVILPYSYFSCSMCMFQWSSFSWWRLDFMSPPCSIFKFYSSLSLDGGEVFQLEKEMLRVE